MAANRNNEEERLLTSYIEGMKLVKKRLQQDGLFNISAPEQGTCHCYVNSFAAISHLRLSRENIQSTLGISLIFGRILHHDNSGHCPTISRAILTPPPLRNFRYPLVLSNIHLQWNELEKIEGLEVLANTLRVLSLSHNKISNLQESAACLRALPKLGLLDLSNNNISRFELDPLPFPPSVIILDLRGNAVCQPGTYQETLLEKLPKLLHLDGDDYSEDSDSEEPNEKSEKPLDIADISQTSRRISSEASHVMETTMDEILARSRARVELILNKIATTKNQGVQQAIAEEPEEPELGEE